MLAIYKMALKCINYHNILIFFNAHIKRIIIVIKPVHFTLLHSRSRSLAFIKVVSNIFLLCFNQILSVHNSPTNADKKLKIYFQVVLGHMSLCESFQNFQNFSLEIGRKLQSLNNALGVTGLYNYFMNTQKINPIMEVLFFR